MKKWRRRVLIAVAVVALTLGVLYECATHIGRGWLRGEAFFDGRPTSYWRGELAHWEIVDATPFTLIINSQAPIPAIRILNYQRDLTWLERLKEGDWKLWNERPGRLYFTNESGTGPSILGGEPEAQAVLRELLDDPSPRVRQFARIGLKLAEPDVTP